MRAIILAAGRGVGLQQPGDQQLPKCLLPFGGRTLLQRHLQVLRALGVDQVVLAVGFRHELIEAELDRLRWRPRPQIVLNPRFELGSMLTLHTVAEAMTRGGDVLLMDADVLYDDGIMTALLSGPEPLDRLLLDRNVETGEEPVKLCIRNGVPIELRKRLADGLTYDVVGKCVGFFRISHTSAQRLTALVADYIARDGAHLPHQEAIRDLLLEEGSHFDVTEVTGLPWIEIDLPDDVVRANRDVLPMLSAAGATP